MMERNKGYTTILVVLYFFLAASLMVCEAREKTPTESAFDTMGSDSWLDLAPLLPMPGTSQVGAGYARENDFLITYGGHPYGGGYPQIDWVGIYKIRKGSQSTWKIPDAYSVGGSTAPPGACQTSAAYDPVNGLYLLWSAAGYLSTRHEWARRFYSVERPRGPFAYDYKTRTWYLTGLLNYIPISFSGRVAFDCDSQTLFQANSKHDRLERFGIIDLWKNTFKAVKTDSWQVLGPGRGLAAPRDDLCLVYDNKRKRFWCVGGHILTSDEGVNAPYQTVWYAYTSDYTWKQETGVIPGEYLIENWDLGEWTKQWTGGKNISSANIDKVAKNKGSLGLHIMKTQSEAFLYKDLRQWNHPITYLRYVKVVSNSIKNGEKVGIVRHYSRKNGVISTLWLHKSLDKLYFDVRSEDDLPKGGYEIRVGRPYQVAFESSLGKKGHIKLYVDPENYASPDITRRLPDGSHNSSDRLYLGVFEGEGSCVEILIDGIFHWNKGESLCFLPWTECAYSACYDSLHDRILMFVLYNNSQHTGPRSSQITKLKCFAYDPTRKKWSVMSDRPVDSRGPRRTRDLNAEFSDRYNVAFVVEAGRCETNCGTLWAYRYDVRPADNTPISIKRKSLTPPYPRFGFVEMLSSKKAKIHWTPLEGEVEGYNIYRAVVKFETYPVGTEDALRNEVPSYDRKVVKLIERPQWKDFKKLNRELLREASFVDTDIDVTALRRIYAYVVKGYKESVESGPSPYWCTIPEFPTGVRVEERPGSWAISWTKPHEGGKGIKGYRVFYTPSPITVAEYTNEILTENQAIIPKSFLRGSGKIFVVAVDNLGQEGFPSNGVWTYHPQYKKFYKRYFGKSTNLEGGEGTH